MASHPPSDFCRTMKTKFTVGLSMREILLLRRIVVNLRIFSFLCNPNFSPPNNRCNARFCAHSPKFNQRNEPHFACSCQVCQPCKFQKERNLFAFPACRLQLRKRNLRKINLASRRQKRYSPTKRSKENDESAKRGTISAET